MRKGLLNKIGMMALMATIVIGGVAVGSKKVKASEVEPRLLEETEHGNCGEPEAYRSSIAIIYEEVYYSFKNGVLTIYGRSDTTKEHVSDYRFIKILNSYFENCTNIEKVVVNVDEIIFGVNAFKGCTNLTTITMPKVIYSLSTSAFEGCEKLESIIFPDGCYLDNSGIGENCFKNCTSLTSIELPTHCNQINSGAFEGCTNLETVVFEEIVDYRGKNRPLYSTPFNECSNLTTIVMKNKNSDLNDDNSIISIKTIIDYAASASSNFSTIKVPYQYANDAREYIENQLEIDLGSSLEKPIDVIAICSVAFDNNGYDTAPDSILTEENTLITAPTPLTDDTKCFAGWYKEAACENAWDFENDLVTEDITLYAKWNDNHNYADVTDSGIHKCVICGKEESHDFTNQSYQPDDFGMHFKKCKYCEAETVHELHIFDEGVVTKEPTEAEEGVTLYTCTVCEATKEEPIEKLTHKAKGEWKKDANTHWHECENCDGKLEEAAHTWNEGVVTKEPTEASEGVKLYTCTVCEQTKEEPVEKLTHKAKGEWKKNADTHWHECENCTGKIDVATHTWDSGVVTKEPTLFEEGIKTYTCTICGQTKEEPIERHVHDEVVDLYVAPTCELSGKSAGSHCSICGTVIKAQKEIAPLGHKLSEGIVTKAATASETGIMTYSCTRTGCTHKIEKIIPTIKESEDVVGEDSEILTNPEKPVTDTTINVIGVKDATYTGSAVTFDLRVYAGKTLLKEGTDYSVKYLNNKTVPVADASGTIADAKKPQVVITGKGAYKDKEVYKFNPIYFAINPVNMEELEKTGDIVVSNEVVLAVKNKKLVKPVPSITLDGKKLNKNDYKVSYGASNEAGIDASVVGKNVITLTGKGNYTGSVTSVYEVVANPAVDKSAGPVVMMSKASIKGTKNSIAYTGGSEVKQTGYTVQAKVGKTTETLTEGTDYTVAYTDNKEIGTASMIIKAKAGNNKGLVGEKVVTFKITGTAMNKLTYTYDNKADYTGSTIKPGITGHPVLNITDKTDKQNSKTLNYGTDYEIEYLKNVQAGTATMLITGKGFYTGTVKKTFKIVAVDLEKNTGINAELIVGSVKKETEGKLKNKYTAKVVVTYNGKELKEGKDYTISYKNNAKPGRASSGKSAPTVVIKGKGNFAKTRNVLFDIVE